LKRLIGPKGFSILSLRMRLIPLFLIILLTTACPWGMTLAVKDSPTPIPAITSQHSTPSLTPDSSEKSVVMTPPAPTVYIVRRGNSLSKIAQAHGLATEQLAKFNKLDLKKPIFSGQKLLIPAATGGKQKPPTLSKQEAMIRSALSYRGVRYHYGGISSRGIDCSGLVVRVFMNQGVEMPHNAAALYGKGKPVSKAALSRGDLVFFHTRGRSLRISHVGIYLGEGNFIHASSGRGRVRTDTLLSGYYAQHFVGARRIIGE
jgi:peptidoglycan DL-endopeptidase LytE